MSHNWLHTPDCKLQNESEQVPCLQAHINSTAPRTAPAWAMPSIPLGLLSHRLLPSQSCATATRSPKQTGWVEGGCTPPPGPPAPMTDPGSTLPLMKGLAPTINAARSALCILSVFCDILCSYLRVCCQSCLPLVRSLCCRHEYACKTHEY